MLLRQGGLRKTQSKWSSDEGKHFGLKTLIPAEGDPLVCLYSAKLDRIMTKYEKASF